MATPFLFIRENPFVWAVAALLLLYLGARMIIGFRKFKQYQAQLTGDGLLRSRNFALITFKFPLIRRFTFAHIRLSKRRLILFHFLTRGMMLVAPLGPAGKPGKEGGHFEVEQRGGKTVLTLHAAMRGGGRIRMNVDDAKGWLDDIVKHGS